jgi:hypothetical protein
MDITVLLMKDYCKEIGCARFDRSIRTHPLKTCFMYIEIEKLIAEAKKEGMTKVSTCDARHWDQQLHSGMLALHKKQPEDLLIQLNVNWGVCDWLIVHCPED